MNNYNNRPPSGGRYVEQGRGVPMPQQAGASKDVTKMIIAIILAIGMTGIGFLSGALAFGAIRKNQVTSVPTPTNVRVETIDSIDYLIWTAVTAASGYAVHLGGSEIREVLDGNKLNLSFARADDVYSFRVKSLGDNGNYGDSAWSNVTTYTKPSNPNAVKLDAPTITKSGTIVSWAADPNAESYRIENGAQPINTELKSTSYDLKQLGYGTFSIRVRANGDGERYSNSEFSNTLNYENIAEGAVKLAAPTGLAINGTTLSWGAVANASSYNIKIGSNDYSSAGTSTSYELSNLSAGTYRIAVQAKGDGYNYSNSDYSESLSYTVDGSTTPPPDGNQLQAPIIYLLAKGVKWNAINGAAGYDVDIDGVVTRTTDASYSLDYLTAFKTYSIKVKAIAGSGKTDSEWSNTVHYVLSDVPPLTGDTSPDAVQSRWESYISREYFEELFPNRFGTDNWKNDGWNVQAYYRDEADRNSKTDYYSYDNWIEALRTLAGLKATYAWDVHDNPILVSVHNTRTGATRTVTSKLPRNARVEMVDYGDFLNSRVDNDNKRELAGFLAQMSHESGAWRPDDAVGIDSRYAWGFAWNEETSYIGSTNAPYSTAHAEYPPVDGKSYHGRGPIQLTWNYNYGFFSELIFNDKNVLLNRPEMLVEDGTLGIMSAIWFWMTPQSPKASCHDIMLNKFVPDTTGPYSVYYNCFGLTIVVVNGYYESDKTAEEWPQVGHRIHFYQRYTQILGADITGEKLDTKGFPQWGGL